MGDGWDYFDGTVSTITQMVKFLELIFEGAEETHAICVDLDSCTDVIFTPAAGWAYENSWSISDADGNIVASGADASGVLGNGCIFGCTDEAATNYNPDAVGDDGSCDYGCDGVDIGDGGTWQTEVAWSITDCDET